MAIVVGLGFVAAGLVVVRNHLIMRRKRQRADGWPTAEARIAKLRRSGMGTKVRTIGGDPKDDEYGKYFVDLEYTYTVGGESRSSSRVSFGSDPIVKQEVVLLFEQYAEGETTRVYYDPQDPEFAVLMLDRPGGKPNSALWMGVIAILAGCTVVAAQLLRS